MQLIIFANIPEAPSPISSYVLDFSSLLRKY